MVSGHGGAVHSRHGQARTRPRRRHSRAEAVTNAFDQIQGFGMSDRKADLLKELDDARAYLNETLARLDDDTEIYPGWKKREFIAHIAGWEAMCYEAFRD